MQRLASLRAPTALLALFAAAVSPSLLADAPPLGPFTFDQGRGTIELIERLRYEDRSENFDFNSAAHSPTDDSWFVQRIRLGATWKPAGPWSVQVQLQDAREWGSERPKVPYILGAEGDDAVDLRLASVTWSDPKHSPLSVTVGRQVLAVGEERLVGPGEWNNFARTFDAAKFGWELAPGKTTLSGFFGSVVHVEGTREGDGWKINRSSADDLFGGLVITHKPSKVDTLEGYVLWRDKKDSAPVYSAPTAPIPAAARTAAAYDIGQNVVTIGGRFARAPQPGAWDAEFEGSVQGGSVDRQTTSATGNYAGTDASLDQRAWAVHGLLGYTPEGAPAKLRVTVEYNAASGDTDRNDDKNGSFMNLFPSNHKFYGFMDVFAWKNLREAVASVRLSPVAKTTLRIDYHRFSLSTAQDAWYRANGVSTVRPLNAAAQSAPRRAGEELDVTGSWTPRAWITLEAGWCRFFAGPYLRATGGASDADYVYVQTTAKF